MTIDGDLPASALGKTLQLKAYLGTTLIDTVPATVNATELTFQATPTIESVFGEVRLVLRDATTGVAYWSGMRYVEDSTAVPRKPGLTAAESAVATTGASSAATAAAQATAANTAASSASAAAVTAAASAAAIEGKLPADDRNMAGAGDTADNLDEVTGGGGGGGTVNVLPVSIRKIAPANVIKLGSRADGTLSDRPTLRIKPGEQTTFLLLLGSRIAKGDPVDDFQRPTSSDETVVTVPDNPAGQDDVNWGLRAEGGVAFALAAPESAAVGATATVSLWIQPEGGDIERPSFSVEIIEGP